MSPVSYTPYKIIPLGYFCCYLFGVDLDLAFGHLYASFARISVILSLPPTAMRQMRLTTACSDIPRAAAASTGLDDPLSFNNASTRSSMLMSHSSKSPLRSTDARSFPAAAPAAGSGIPHLLPMDSKRSLAISILLCRCFSAPLRMRLRGLILGPTPSATVHPAAVRSGRNAPHAEEHHEETEEEENGGNNAPQP